ncbi:recombinase family protein [Nocardiopsis potens]|uniref:recombinase family protein n=1 Tax=Nocardiopsis potens TaxID=1246458 RepID=UPI0003640B21|nr:recombinase family protein [Nocardiopsis potens]
MTTHLDLTARPDGSPLRARSYDRQSERRDDGSTGGPSGRRNACIARAAQGAHGVPFAHTGHYEDIGRSGWDLKAARPDFDRMMEDARRGEFDVLIIFALSRLTRKGFRDALDIHDELQKCGVRLISVTEPFLDTGDPMGVAMFALIAAMAEQQSTDKSAFGKSTNAAIRERGGWLGGRPSLGLRMRKKIVDGVTIRVPEPEPAEAPFIDELATRVLAREKMHTIMEDYAAREIPSVSGGHKDGEMPHWSVTRIHRILRDPRIAGIVGDVIPERAAKGHPDRYRIRRNDDGTPMLAGKGAISPEKWFLVQAELDRRSVERGPRSSDKPRSLLGGTGLVKCESGFAFSWGGQDNYACSRHTTCPAHKGRRRTVKTRHLDEWLARTVLTRIAALDPHDEEDAAMLSAAASAYQGAVGSPDLVAERNSVQAELATVTREIGELYEDRRAGVYPGPRGRAEFIKDLNARQQEEIRLNNALDALNRKLESPVLPIEEWCATDDPDGDPIGEGSWWKSASAEDRQLLLKIFVDHVTVNGVDKKISGRTRGYHVGKRAEIHWRRPENDETESEARNA